MPLKDMDNSFRVSRILYFNCLASSMITREITKTNYVKIVMEDKRNCRAFSLSTLVPVFQAT